MSRIFQSRLDEEEFLKIIKGFLSKNLKRYLERGLIKIPRPDGSGVAVIPVETIDIPTFRYGFPGDPEIGQGDGEVGDDLGPVEGDDKEGKPKAGGGQGHGGRRPLPVEVSLEEFHKLFQEELELPNIKPKGDRAILEERDRYSSISKHGSPSQLHVRRTMKEAMKRAVADGSYRPPDKTVIIPNNDDFRYRSSEKILVPQNSAVCFWKRDGSGSMGPDERRVVNYLVDICEFWLSCFYDHLVNIYIIHDDHAIEVTRDEFFTEYWGGGTACSAALSKMLEIVGEKYPVDQWNIYGTYLSDGLNFSSDNAEFERLLVDDVLPIVNQYNYGQIDLERPWWSEHEEAQATTFSAPGTIGEMIEDIVKNDGPDNLAFAQIYSDDENAISEAVKIFFGKGH